MPLGLFQAWAGLLSEQPESTSRNVAGQPDSPASTTQPVDRRHSLLGVLTYPFRILTEEPEEHSSQKEPPKHPNQSSSNMDLHDQHHNDPDPPSPVSATTSGSVSDDIDVDTTLDTIDVEGGDDTDPIPLRPPTRFRFARPAPQSTMQTLRHLRRSKLVLQLQATNSAETCVTSTHKPDSSMLASDPSIDVVITSAKAARRLIPSFNGKVERILAVRAGSILIGITAFLSPSEVHIILSDGRQWRMGLEMARKRYFEITAIEDGAGSAKLSPGSFDSEMECEIGSTARWVLRRRNRLAFSPISPSRRRHPVVARVDERGLTVKPEFRDPGSSAPSITPAFLHAIAVLSGVALARHFGWPELEPRERADRDLWERRDSGLDVDVDQDGPRVVDHLGGAVRDRRPARASVHFALPADGAADEIGKRPKRTRHSFSAFSVDEGSRAPKAAGEMEERTTPARRSSLKKCLKLVASRLPGARAVDPAR